MSLDTVAEDIREEARERADEIREAAREEADEIREAAREEAEETLEAAEERVEAEIAQEREQAVSSAKLEAKQARLEARRAVLQDVREAVADELAAIDGERRESLSRELLDAAVAEFDDGADLLVRARANDEELVRELVSGRDGVAYDGTYDCLGGVVVESEASSVRVNNTFDAVLDDVWEDELKAVSDRLFEET